MDIVKTASDWAQFEMHSAAVLAAFGLAFLLAGLGFRHWGATDFARAFLIPMLVAGGMLLILGIGLGLTAQARLATVPAASANDDAAFLTAELTRADKVLNDYRIAVFQVFPGIIALCALAIPFLADPNWRASLMTAVALLIVLIFVDSNADARLKDYRQQLSVAHGSK